MRELLRVVFIGNNRSGKCVARDWTNADGVDRLTARDERSASIPKNENPSAMKRRFKWMYNRVITS